MLEIKNIYVSLAQKNERKKHLKHIKNTVCIRLRDSGC